MLNVRSSFFTAILLIIAVTFSAPSAIFATPTDPQSTASGVETASSAATTVEEAHSRWLTGAQAASQVHGCTNTIEQKYGESIADAVKIFGMTAVEGSCLLLQPVSNNLSSGRYSFAWGGQVNGFDIIYISDVGKVRIWNSVEVPLN